MGLNWAEHTLEIDAPIETCFDAITDYESFPSWQGAVDDTEVLERGRDGLGKVVRLFIDAKVRKVDYTLDYRYDRPDRIEWDFVEGNGINGADGHYLFEELGDGRTRATYKLGLEVGIPMPGMVARRVHKQTLKASVEDLKREAERRQHETGGSLRSPLASTEPAAGEPRRAEPAADRPRASAAARGSDESVREAAFEVASATSNLGRTVARRTISAVTGLMNGVARRLGG